jgi:hypothetical protein
MVTKKETEKEIRYKRMEKFFVEIFNAIGFLGLSCFALLGLVMFNTLQGIPIMQNILYSGLLMFMFISFMFVKRMV